MHELAFDLGLIRFFRFKYLSNRLNSLMLCIALQALSECAVTLKTIHLKRVSFIMLCREYTCNFLFRN